jgi:hypothetical protein
MAIGEPTRFRGRVAHNYRSAPLVQPFHLIARCLFVTGLSPGAMHPRCSSDSESKNSGQERRGGEMRLTEIGVDRRNPPGVTNGMVGA